MRTSTSITQNEVDAYTQFALENKIITDGDVGIKTQTFSVIRSSIATRHHRSDAVLELLANEGSTAIKECSPLASRRTYTQIKSD